MPPLKLVAAFPEGAVEFRFLDGHFLNGQEFYHAVAINWRIFALDNA
jgi:hypothetical protein